MKLYYQDEAVTIYHGDCRELPECFKADVLITDPPYGVDFKGKTTKHTRPSGGYTTEDSDIGLTVVSQLLPRVKRAAIFTGIRLLQQYPVASDIGCVFCPSGAGCGRWGFACLHPVLFYGPDPYIANGRTPASITSFETSGDYGHPCPKPQGWLNWLVQKASVEGEVVIDPFCGTGTTLRACKDFGRKGMGIEIEERYCEIAAKRCAQGVLSFT